MSIWNKLSPFTRDLIGRLFWTAVIVATGVEITQLADLNPAFGVVLVGVIQIVKNYAIGLLSKDPVQPATQMEKLSATLLQTLIAAGVTINQDLGGEYVVYIATALSLVKGIAAKYVGNPNDAAIVPVPPPVEIEAPVEEPMDEEFAPVDLEGVIEGDDGLEDAIGPLEPLAEEEIAGLPEGDLTPEEIAALPEGDEG